MEAREKLRIWLFMQDVTYKVFAKKLGVTLDTMVHYIMGDYAVCEPRAKQIEKLTKGHIKYEEWEEAAERARKARTAKRRKKAKK